MNRRGFLDSMLKAGAAAMALPAATTYLSAWKAPAPDSGRKIWLLDWSDIEPCVVEPVRFEWIENFSE